MKTYLNVVSLLALTGLLGASCQREAGGVGPGAEKVVVATAKSARLKQDVVLTVDKIEDSRCPANAVCVWYGSAKVLLTLKKDSEQRTAELCLGQCDQKMKDRDVTTVTLGGRAYEVTLTEVRPFPGTTPTPQQPEAVIEVK